MQSLIIQGLLKNRRRKWATAVVLVAFVFLALVGPWPPSERAYQDTAYANDSFERIAQWTPALTTGPLTAGYGEADITPSIGVPLAGYSGRDPKTNTGHLQTLYAKAISINNGVHTLSLLSGDFLLPLPELVDAICARARIARDDIYFGSTHTHSGPGAYANGVIGEFALGPFDAAQLARLADAFAQAILDSRKAMFPAEIRVDQYRLAPELANSFIVNHFAGAPAHNTLNVAQVFDISRVAAVPRVSLVTFSAHPTFFNKHNRLAHGDYPGALQEKLRSRLGHPVIFMAGAVGGMGPTALGPVPTRDSSDAAEAIEDYSERLSALIAGLARGMPVNGVTNLRHLRLRKSDILSRRALIQLPPPAFRVAGDWIMSPWLVHRIFHGDETELQFARIGSWVLWGFPADFSGELALTLEDFAHSQQALGWITSFSGDYIGYIMPHTYYALDSYESRGANVYGPWAGEFLSDAARRLATRAWPEKRTTNFDARKSN